MKFRPLTALFCCLLPLLGQATERPKIGVALSGGGARGGAHIGVLRAIEDAQIPIDCIAGTSMGATVAGMYAAGYSIDEIEKSFRELNWSVGFTDKTPRAELSYRRKQDDAGFLVDFDVGIREGEISLPRGVLVGQSLNLQLKLLTTRARHIHDFDQLPIPFRAIAADLTTGEAVILKDGDLADALHASAAIPGVYEPVERDGRLLVDGGVAQNLPVETVRELCADIVIAVDISTPMRNKDELNSLVDVLDQLSNMLTRRNTEASIATLQAPDVLIRPNLADYSASDFLRMGAIIESGYQTASAAIDKLEPIVALTGRVPRELANNGTPPVRVQKIKLDNQSQVDDVVILTRLKHHLGKPLDQQQLHTDLARLHGTGYFGFIDYRINVDEFNQATTVIEVNDHPLGPHFLRFDVAIEDSFRGDSEFTIGARHTYMPTNALGGEWRNEVQFGDRARIFTEWFQPWTYNGNWFSGLSLEWQRRKINLTDGERILAELKYTGTEAKLYGGYQYLTNAHVLAGIRSGTGDLKERIGITDINIPDLDTGEVFVEIGFDKLDHRYFPQHGRSGTLNVARGLQALGADEEYDKWTLNWFQASTRGRHTFGYQVLAGSFVSDVAPLQENYELGGFLRLSGFNRAELVGPHMRLFNVYYLNRLNTKASAALDTPIFLGASVELGNIWQQRENISVDDTVLAGSLFLGMDTTFGPLYLAYGVNDQNRDALYLFLGSPF
ncbi:patatin-like phospholipase family protein [Permianibacter aggregans]|uniref:NTE family protein n=1 Tax=Permianibacter aggregans TaxID=1510150 RepID=A0A4R6UUE6_9GAMM|nr:patatin-like phospholipase family protein [Permianibacter aggregans]TDQ49886.1 NTE family protein [Permianibacter aggregans]